MPDTRCKNQANIKSILRQFGWVFGRDVALMDSIVVGSRTPHNRMKWRIGESIRLSKGENRWGSIPTWISWAERSEP